MSDLKAIMDALIAGNEKTVLELVQSGLDKESDPGDMLNKGLIAGMDIVGEKMEAGDMFIPEVLRCAKVMGKALELLKPLLGEDAGATQGTAVIGTVKGDLHDIGKNLVSMMLESAGFRVADLGIDVTPEQFCAAAKDNNANLVGVSALLTTTMPMMKQTVDALVEAGIRDNVKVMVGGAPVTQKFSDEIGADGYAPDAGSAVKAAKALLA